MLYEGFSIRTINITIPVDPLRPTIHPRTSTTGSITTRYQSCRIIRGDVVVVGGVVQ